MVDWDSRESPALQKAMTCTQNEPLLTCCKPRPSKQRCVYLVSSSESPALKLLLINHNLPPA